ncbi:VOC family protein [Hyphomonas sp.]|uniref:VOC family protein n=1 Tax=Hyphomonas sp. TaxID=87 RepID=UPI0030F9B28C
MADTPRGQRITALSLLVPDYGSGIGFYVGKLGFDLLEDTDMGGGKRWVRVRPKGGGVELLLAQGRNGRTTRGHWQPVRRACVPVPRDR